jgi:sn-glycerol 3-phosphate transport system ATP-binding protein
VATIGIEAVSKTYPNGFKALHGIDIDIGDGEFVVLVGPSGCGKSTLLRMIAGLEEVTGGEISIGGRTVNRLEPAERNIAMVFQNYALYPHMSVYENMAYGLKNRGMAKNAIAERVQEAARILELGDLLQNRPRQLSGGQRQRVAMGRAIVREPAVFLFDEPLSNLDAKLRAQMRVEIKRLQRRLGTTSVYVTHDQVEAMTMADRLVVMNEGRVEQIGTPVEVYERPESVFVAGFMGAPAMNLLDGEIGAEQAARLAGVAATIPISSPAAGGQNGRQVVIGIRPEHIQLAGGDQANLELTVEISEPLGAETLVHASIGDPAQTLIVRCEARQRFSEGERLPVTVPAEHVTLFDRDSGRRLV